ncbi:MAG TPA: acyltransferase domain-containing protein [Lapillicoccus sp.]|uniref:acyltransferase domain-containing protein n=1 Tax=Lapillicoccus sp. TaxID=1909287 RepID=UPI002F94DCA4
MTRRPALTEQALALFAVSADDLDGVQTAARAVCDDAHLAEWVDRTATDLRAAMGEPSPPPALTPRPEGDPAVLAYLPVVAFAEALPATLAWADHVGLAPNLMAATMRDVGRMLRRNRVWFGNAGLGDELAGWLPRHLVGSILEIGRLQHERCMPGMRTSAWFLAEGADWSPGEPGVNLHIPESGPLDPGAVRESLRAGRTVMRRRFPDQRLRVRYCISWLLDPQLLEYLPETSNIAQFQRLFRVGPAKDDDGDSSVRKFVFGNPAGPVESLPQRSSLERAAVAHWRAGRHWRVHVGRVA